LGVVQRLLRLGGLAREEKQKHNPGENHNEYREEELGS
jgi:hypothetical protein